MVRGTPVHNPCSYRKYMTYGKMKHSLTPHQAVLYALRNIEERSNYSVISGVFFFVIRAQRICPRCTAAYRLIVRPLSPCDF
jgi:hypothetical protein